MSQFLSELDIFGNTLMKNEIKYYHVCGIYFKLALFVTNDDKVYGIDIPYEVMTSSYERVIEERKNRENYERLTPIEIKELSGMKIKEFFIENDFVLALSQNDKLYSWGNNDHGQLGRYTENDIDCNPSVISDIQFNIKQVCVHQKTIMILLDNGKVIVWGSNEFGWKSEKPRFGVNITEIFDWKSIRKPMELNSLDKIEFIHMNYNGCFAIDNKYNVLSWGFNGYGELGQKISSFIYEPAISKILSNLKIITIKSELFMTYLLSSDGKIYICGMKCFEMSKESNRNGLGLIQIESNENCKQLEKIDYRFVALSEENIVYEVKEKLYKTQFKSIEEYSVMNCGITYKTCTARVKDSKIILDDIIGHGGFGKVYKIFYQLEYYAIKKLKIEDSDTNNLEKYRELLIMKQLKSDFVVKLYDYWTDEEEDFEFLYIQMELCDQTLKDIMDDKNRSFPPIIHLMIRTEIFGQLLFALNYLHSMTPKVIHRDIKPSNVLIKYYSYHAQVKLCDFGLSKILDKETSNTSNIGTFKYKAPEIFSNNYNEKVDIYSLGIIIREMFENHFNLKSNEYGVNTKLNKLEIIINKMIYSPPSDRPSAMEIYENKSDWSFDLNDELIAVINNNKEDCYYEPIKFLKFPYSKIHKLKTSSIWI